jgi:peptidyl-prolyl cis-trans isomerase A (cyclophilin A)
MKKLFATALLLFFTLVPALSAQEKEAEKKRDPGLYATLSTSMGDIVIELYEKESPKTVGNFVLLATGKQSWRNPTTGETVEGTPYFEGIIFHRVIPRFMIQTGDPTGTGRGGPGYTIPDEFDSNLKFDKAGVLGMANSGPNTGGSQFFITHRATPHLTGKHTIFGQVIEGQDIVVKIGNVRRNQQDKPFEDIVIKKVILQRVKEETPSK